MAAPRWLIKSAEDGHLYLGCSHDGFDASLGQVADQTRVDALWQAHVQRWHS